MTWTEIFMIVQICYQFAVMIILWLTYGHSRALGSSRKFAASINHWCLWWQQPSEKTVGKTKEQQEKPKQIMQASQNVQKNSKIPAPNTSGGDLGVQERSSSTSSSEENNSLAMSEETSKTGNRPNLVRSDKHIKRTKLVETAEAESYDWIGRWFVVPSYVIVMLSLILGGWGFY